MRLQSWLHIEQMAAELWHYLSMMQQDVEKETDIVEWWQVQDLMY